MAYEVERRIAIDAVTQACRVAQAVAAELISEETISKKDKSPVTVADYSVQAQISLALGQAFPNDPVVGEEETSELMTREGEQTRAKVVRFVTSTVDQVSEAEIMTAIDRCSYIGGNGGRYWAVDPIDGTKGFLRAEQYAVALALIEDGQVILGVLGCPNLPVDARYPDGAKGCLFVGVRNQGSVQINLGDTSEVPIRVTNVSNSADASFCESVEAGHSSHDDAARIAAALGVSAPPIRMDSQCKYGAVGRGDASIYLRLPTRADYEEKIWDHAAGYIVITEAGGKVTDIHGKLLDFSLGRTLSANQGVVATNSLLHDEVLAAI